MLLLLMRHGIAEPLGEPFPDDAVRPLTSEGRDRSHRAARGLRHLVPHLDALVSSSKIRAKQTAQQVRDAYGKGAPAISEWPELAGDDFDSWRERLREHPDATVLLVGHETHLSRFVTQTLGGKRAKWSMEWKKVGVCALEIDDHSGAATLLWFLPPRALRKLAG